MAGSSAPTFDHRFDDLSFSKRNQWDRNYPRSIPGGKNQDGNTTSAHNINPDYAPPASVDPSSINNRSLDIAVGQATGSIIPTDIIKNSRISGLS